MNASTSGQAHFPMLPVDRGRLPRRRRRSGPSGGTAPSRSCGRLTATFIGALVVGVGFGACSRGITGAASRSNPSTSTPAASLSSTAPVGTSGTSTTQSQSPAPTTAPPTSPSPTSPVSVGPTTCSTDQLTISMKGISGGAGHGGYAILFKNTGKACTLHGYPGLDAVDASGKVVVSAQRTTNGYLGGLTVGAAEPTVELQTGQTVSTLFEGHIGPISGGPSCPPYVALLITPPNETHSVRLTSDYTLCYLEVHPVVQGATGGANAP